MWYTESSTRGWAKMVTLRLRDVRFRHQFLRQAISGLLRALEGDTYTLPTAFKGFREAVASHIALEGQFGYRALLSHREGLVREMVGRWIEEQQEFDANFDEFVKKWQSSTDLISPEFRDEVEHLVASLLKRMQVEERIVAALSVSA